MSERSDAFPCFGSTCAVHVGGSSRGTSALQALALAKSSLLAWHRRFTRFDPGSELSRLNADPRPAVPVEPLMARLADAVVGAAHRTGGLVDATMIGALEAAGYVADLPASPPLAAIVRAAPARRPARPRADAAWRRIQLTADRRTLRRPPGLRIDGGGLAKGLFADVLAARLAGHDSFAIDCAGDVRVGGRARRPRELRVACPFEDRVLHVLELCDGAAATSGIGRRSWIRPDGSPAHHLLDPATGRPAFTGVVQATAVAPSALEAEVRAKAAVLSGPQGACAWLPHGGVVVLDDGTTIVRRPPSADLSTS